MGAAVSFALQDRSGEAACSDSSRSTRAGAALRGSEPRRHAPSIAPHSVFATSVVLHACASSSLDSPEEAFATVDTLAQTVELVEAQLATRRGAVAAR